VLLCVFLKIHSPCTAFPSGSHSSRYGENKCNKFSFFFIYILQHGFCIWPNPLHHPSSARTISFSSARISAVWECSPSNYYKQGTIVMQHGCSHLFFRSLGLNILTEIRARHQQQQQRRRLITAHKLAAIPGSSLQELVLPCILPVFCLQ